MQFVQYERKTERNNGIVGLSALRYGDIQIAPW